MDNYSGSLGLFFGCGTQDLVGRLLISTFGVGLYLQSC